MRFLPPALFLLALVSVPIAAVMQPSRSKGQLRLLGSMSLAAGFVVGSILQMAAESREWPASLGLAAGIFLAWVGLRKYRKDPDGRTPPADIL